MTKPIPDEFQNPAEISQRLIINNDLLKQAGSQKGMLKIDDFKDARIAADAPQDSEKNGVAISSSISVLTFNNADEFIEEKFSSQNISSDTLFSADSMTKMVTAATILRMTEESKYRYKPLPNGSSQDFFPNGIETKLSDILPILKKHYSNSVYITKHLETQPNFNQITLQHLAIHTSGLADFAEKELFANIYSHSEAYISSSDRLFDEVNKKSKTNNIGEYSYNNLGYELLGRVVVSIAREIEPSKNFGDVVNELVINRVKEKIGEEGSKKLKFFTSDKMSADFNGNVSVEKHPELSVEVGKNYHDQKFQRIMSWTNHLSAAGAYTNPYSMSAIAYYILSNKLEHSIFQNQSTVDILNSTHVAINQHQISGFGYKSFSIPGYERFRFHNGDGFGSHSSVMVDVEKNKVATAMITSENLTLPIAYALKHQKRPENSAKITPELYENILELSKTYSEVERLEMRNSLEKSYESFSELFDKMMKQKLSKPSFTALVELDLAVPQKPSTNSVKSYAEKMSQIKGSNFNEI